MRKTVAPGKVGNISPTAVVRPTGIDAVEFAKTVRQKKVLESSFLPPWIETRTKQGFKHSLTRAISDAVSVPVDRFRGVGTWSLGLYGVTKGGAILQS